MNPLTSDQAKDATPDPAGHLSSGLHQAVQVTGLDPETLLALRAVTQKRSDRLVAIRPKDDASTR